MTTPEPKFLEMKTLAPDPDAIPDKGSQGNETAKLPTADLNQAASMAADVVDSDDGAIRGCLLMDYGDSGDGKSTRLHSLARYYYLKTGLKVRLVAAEDSSKLIFQDLIDAGIVEAIFLDGSRTDLSTYERITEGEWPLVDQFDVTYKTVKQGGKEVNQEIRKQKWQPKSEWAGTVSAYIFEGLSTMCENILAYLTERGRFEREQKDGFQEGGRTYMAASQTAFGFTQSEGIKLVRTSGTLPVERVAWSAHEAKGKDEMDGLPVRGPRLVGSAATNLIRKHVGVLLHTDRVKDQIRVHFRNHADQTAPAVQWKAKVTVAPAFAGEFDKVYKDGFFVPTLPTNDYATSRDGLIPFLELEATIREKSHQAASRLLGLVKR